MKPEEFPGGVLGNLKKVILSEGSFSFKEKPNLSEIKYHSDHSVLLFVDGFETYVLILASPLQRLVSRMVEA